MKSIKTKIFLTTVVVFLGLSSSKAQKFSVGLLGGLHAYKVSFEDKDDRDIYKSKPKLGYRTGVYLTFPLKNDFTWSTELYYSKKGRKLKVDNDFVYNNYVNNADYTFIELSVLLRKAYLFNLLKGLQGKWFFNIGPNINYWWKGDGNIDATASLDYKVVFENRETGDFTNNYIVDGNRFLFGLDFGVGFEAPLLGNQIIQTEFRFTLGQTFLGTKDGSIPVNDFQVDDNLRSNYRVISVIVRYGLNLDVKDAKKGKSTIKRSRRRRY